MQFATEYTIPATPLAEWSRRSSWEMIRLRERLNRLSVELKQRGENRLASDCHDTADLISKHLSPVLTREPTAAEIAEAASL